jgi:NADH dehydrogenase FAD-containing subunit
VVDILATGYSDQGYLPKSGYAVYSQGKVVAKLINARLNGKKPEEEYMQREDNKRKEITAKRYEEWAKVFWRELFG